MNLHETWSGMASTLATTTTDSHSVEDVTGALVDEDTHRRGKSGADIAMMARGHRGTRRGDRSTIV
ncbi:hypothetical protein M408DRAFT_333052, partial [Serendipita vermifera MAFF 305830]